jgi:fluoride ion exporter CrcB/FEX
MRTAVAIAVAGALGALARYGLEENIDSVVPLLDEMVQEGILTVERVHVVSYRGSKEAG